MNKALEFVVILSFKLSKTLANKQVSDEQVVSEIVINRKAEMIDILYSRYAERVYQKCFSFVKDSNLAEDLTHDIFIKMYLNLASFEGRSKFSTWFYSITYNFCIEHLRKSQKEKYVSIEDDGKVVDDLEVESLENLQHIKADRLGTLLEKMKSDDKMILIMKYKDDMSIKEIQETLKISESAVKMRIKRAKEKINELYNQHYAYY